DLTDDAGTNPGPIDPVLDLIHERFGDSVHAGSIEPVPVQIRVTVEAGAGDDVEVDRVCDTFESHHVAAETDACAVDQGTTARSPVGSHLPLHQALVVEQSF